MNKKLKAAAAVFLTAAALTVTACSSNTAASKPTVDKVNMTYVDSPLNVPSILEKEKGMFKEAYEKQGVGFEYSDIASGSEQTAAMASGDVQILNAVGGSSVILAAANDADIVILSMYSKAPEAFVMFSNDESLNSAESLKGKTIAGPKGTNLHELIAAYMKKAGMSMEDVNFVNMDIPSAVAALESGSIDVALVGGTAAYNLEKAGKHKIADGKDLIAATIVTATSKKFAEENPQLVQTFLDTQKKIMEQIESDPDAALAQTAKALDLDQQAVEDMYKLYDFSTEITDQDIELIQSTEQFLYDAGMIENHVDVSKLIYKK